MIRTMLLRSTAFAIGAVAMMGTASAATTWTFTSGSNSATGTEYGNLRTFGSVPNTVDANAWSSTGDKSGGSANTALQSAYLAVYSGGLGVNNQDGPSGADAGDTLSNAPEHAIDNNQRYDSVMFNFGNGKQVNLSHIVVGWPTTSSSPCSSSTCDSDLTVLAYTGAGAPNLTPAGGATYQDLLSSGWKFIANLSNVATFGSTGVDISTTQYAQYWLIGTYIPLTGIADPDTATGHPGGVSCNAQSTDTRCYDYAKLMSLTGSYTKVPEPGSLALLGIALTGAGFLRRQASKK